MFSAETLSWILGARRFASIARICDSRTPVTVTSCSSPASDPALTVPDLGLVALGDGVVGASCCAGSCTPAFSAMAEVVAAASNAMDMAIDKGCLRYTFDTAFPSRLLSFGSQMPYGAWLTPAGHRVNRPWQKCTESERHFSFTRQQHPPRNMASWRLSIVHPNDRLSDSSALLTASIYSVD